MNDPDMTNRELSEQIGDLRKDVDRRFETVEGKLARIDTALYGTGNPHGGLFQQFAVLEGKVTALDAKIDGVESKLEAKIDGVEKTISAKIDGVEEKFDKMFNFAKWTIAIVAIPILIEVVLPMIRRWTGG